MSAVPRFGRFNQPARISQPGSHEAEQQKIAEREKAALQEAMRGTRPPKPVADEPAPVSLNARVKPAPEPELVTASVAVAEPVVPVPDPQLAAALDRHRVAHEALALAQVEVDEADTALAQAQRAHEAQEADRQLQHHRAILQPALAAANRQQAAFLQLWQQYGGAGRGGVTHGPLAKYAKTIPVGDPQRREKLGALYREAAVLMEMIRLGYNAARAAVAATETALSRGGTGDAAEVRFELAGRACAEAAVYIAADVEADCQKLIADVKAVDGEPGPDVLVTLDPTPESPKRQQVATGVGDPI